MTVKTQDLIFEVQITHCLFNPNKSVRGSLKTKYGMMT